MFIHIQNNITIKYNSSDKKRALEKKNKNKKRSITCQEERKKFKAG